MDIQGGRFVRRHFQNCNETFLESGEHLFGFSKICSVDSTYRVRDRFNSWGKLWENGAERQRFLSKLIEISFGLLRGDFGKFGAFDTGFFFLMEDFIYRANAVCQ